MGKEIPKLIYFDFKGKAEAIRLAFYIGGVEFEDERLSREQFYEIKSSTPFSQLPVLQINGKYMSQSIAILYYAGKKAGLIPDDPLEAAKVFQILATLEDIMGKVSPSIHEQNVEKKKEMREKLANEILPFWLGRLNKVIAEEGKSFCVGDKLTIADLQLYVIIGWICLSGIVDGIPTNICDKHTAILQVVKKVENHEKVKEWNAKNAKK